ncbi:DNA-3-methyladenine glycosylase family protein [Gracilimonas sp. Q87]|uniref:DNA-3-methyladenine glycosylase family protein n=1 Tax=Gracilimonas sp. Q87 TaxID=3384766 RepID=UPI0039840452
MSTWTLKSIPPHDWYICLDVESYFDHEHDPEKIFEEGFTRPIPIGDTDVIVTVFFNGDPEHPEFHLESQESLSKEEIKLANKSLAKILGTDMDIRPLYDQAKDDTVLGDKLMDLYGLKRMTRANLFEDILYRIVQMQMNHKPTAKKMMFQIREAYGTALMLGKQSLPAWPRPHQLMKADPANIRKLGPTLRKGQYLVGLANHIVAGNVDMDHLMECEPQEFYDLITGIKGIGPTSGQDLMMMRGRTDAVFPSNKKSGEEKGLRRWIIYSYGEDPHNTSEKRFQELIQNWKGYEAAALEFLYVNYVLKEKEEKAKK